MRPSSAGSGENRGEAHRGDSGERGRDRGEVEDSGEDTEGAIRGAMGEGKAGEKTGVAIREDAGQGTAGEVGVGVPAGVMGTAGDVRGLWGAGL